MVSQVTDNADVRLFEVVKGQDAIMHNISGELGVKTSLYLVFSAFIFSASIQLINFAKDSTSPMSRYAVASCSIGAAISLLSALALLIAALVRTYKIFPSNALAAWIKETQEYSEKYPQEKVEDTSEGILKSLIETLDANQVQNEKKATWIQVGTWLLFISLPFLVTGGALALYSFFKCSA